MPKKTTQTPQPEQSMLLSAPEACKLLGVKPATLYTYVSRGFLKPVQQSDTKANRYWRAEVESLQVRSSARGGHGAAAAMAMRWGQPVLNTSITEITPLGPRYRGHLAEDLTRHPGLFENVAELLWSGVLHDDPRPWRVPPMRADIGRAIQSVGNPDLRIVREFAIAATALGGVSLADELRSGSIAHYSHELLLAFAGCCGVIGPQKRFIEPPAETHVAVHVLHALGVPVTEQATHAMNAALILTADHELAPATFAARIAASVGSGLHACVVAALATQVGSRLGGACDLAERLLWDITSDAQLKSRIQDAEQRRELLPGFGLPLYPDGDPRARILIKLALGFSPASRKVEFALRFVDYVRDNIGIHPNIEVGLAILALSLGLPARSSGAVWAVGRTAGWIAHLLEQRRAGHQIRPRAHYMAQTF
jgi:citrate synthase